MPQPIDPQTEMGRITAAERIQQIADRASLAAQLRHTDEAQDQRVGAEQQVRQTDQKSEQVDEELRRHNPFMGRRRRRKRDEQDAQEGSHKSSHTFYTAHETAEEADDPDGHDLDVTV